MFNYEDFPNKLNLGCGWDIKDGYLNIDFQSFHSPTLVADITNLDMLPSNYYEEIIAQDVLEHIKRIRTQEVLNEWSRLLKPNGIIKLRVPNILGLAKLFTWEDKKPINEQENLIQCLFGTQAYDGDYHYTTFTKDLITHYLATAGLSISSLKEKDEWLLEIVAVK